MKIRVSLFQIDFCISYLLARHFLKYFSCDIGCLVFTITSDFKIEVTNSKTRAREKAREALNECRDLGKYVDDTVKSSPLEQLDRLAECMKESVHSSIYETQAEIDFQADIRRRMGYALKSYACRDPAFPATEPLFTKEWDPNNRRFGKLDGQSHSVAIMLHTDTTMIALIENVAKPSDCKYMQEHATANEKDSSLVPWEARKDPATIDFLARIYAYVDPAVKMMDLYAGLPEKGQDLFRIYHDSSNVPHHEHHHPVSASKWPVDTPVFGRLLLFCEVPQENGGGSIHFTESGVHVRPKMGEGLLITYTKPHEGQGHSETFTNEHIDCPILRGNRTIIEHQFRLFPNSKE